MKTSKRRRMNPDPVPEGQSCSRSSTANKEPEIISEPRLYEDPHEFLRLHPVQNEDEDIQPLDLCNRKEGEKDGADKSSSNGNSSANCRINCPICFDSLLDSSPSCCKCGHIFCESCLRTWLKRSKICPICSTAINIRQIRHVFFQ